MTDSTREFVGVALKTLGQPFNASAATLASAGIGVQELGEALRRLRAQVRLFSSRDHIRALVAGKEATVGLGPCSLHETHSRSACLQVMS